MYIRITALLLLSLPLVHAQSTQNISGRITEQYSAFRVPFALVEVLNSTHRTYSDSLGYFRISGVPTGRVDLRISATGYKPRVLSYLELVAGKELVMNVELTEEVHLLREVVVTSGPRRESQNDMIKASRRHFSIEESKRYAGSLNDVQRMASSFAGVSTADDQVNDLIIRGNTPSGMLFRLDGMNIPNPNHWSMPGSSGGTVSMLNNNVLRNSDFLTGAFAAEYDAFSGVFDLKTRNGNFNRHEFMFQLGFNGLEAGAEGPLDKKRKSSYLFNYRKSLLEVLSTIITPKTGTAVPKYQDLFFKIHFPTRNAGTFSLTGMGGTSDIHFEPDAEKTNNYTFDDLRSGSNTGLAGISHQLSPRRGLTFNTSLMVSSVASKTTINKAEREASSGEIVIKEPYVKNLFEDGKFEIAHYTHFKAGRKDYFKAGFYFDYFMGNYVQDVYSSKIPGTPKYWRRGIDYSGRYTQSNVYLNYLRKITQNTELVAGLSYKYLSLTRKYVLEPKLSASIQTGDKGTLSLGTGLYSKAPSLIHVNTEHFVYDDKGNVVSSSRNNGNLGYMKSFHSVAGYDHYFSPRLHLKTEVYYQRLYDVITARTTSETEGLDNVYASLNEFSFSFDAIPAILANHGKGENYGLEMTLEHFMNDGFYFLATGSVYNSRYRAVDKTWRNTRFNANFVTNLLGGKEFHIKDNLKILADLKLNFMNGNRYIPLLEKETLAKEEAVYDYSRTYTRHLPHFFRADIRIGYKTIGKKITQEMAFEAQNITNRKNVYMQQYNPDTKSLETLYQNGITPMGLYRIYF